MWLYNYFTEKEKPNLKPYEKLSKFSFQLYKKHAIKLKPWAKQLYIALELEAERLIKRYGIKDCRANEKFIKTVQKVAAAKGMTVAEYRDKILFPHGREKILARFKKFYKLKQTVGGMLKNTSII